MNDLDNKFNVFDYNNFQGVATIENNLPLLLLNNTLIAGRLVVANNALINVCIETEDDIYGVIPESVGRFTGLTDCNDVPIYEHDEVCAELEQELHNGTKYEYVQCKATGYVIFHDCQFVVWLDDYSIKSAYGLMPHRVVELTQLSKDIEQKLRFEVVGNKYLKK